MSVVVRGKRRSVRPDSIHVLRGQDTRRRILVAARARVLADGFEALHLDDLAQRRRSHQGGDRQVSVGGKATILLALGEQDRESRLERHAPCAHAAHRPQAPACPTSWAGSTSLDLPRLKLVQAYVGYLWFWSGADHDRAQGHVDGTLDLLTDLMRSAAGPAEAQRPDRDARAPPHGRLRDRPARPLLRPLGHRRGDPTRRRFCDRIGPRVREANAQDCLF